MSAPDLTAIQESKALKSKPMCEGWGYGPQVAFCGKCKHSTVTHAQLHFWLFGWASCVSLALIGWCMCCCVFPFVIKAAQDCTHYCSNCGEQIGKRALIDLTSINEYLR
mmetsp:Transcript_2584/g.5865  ORF Transcript_2584/g.5865 Transcript_2584/m.5865 type:complete len:109 (+) Transcript_2584:201-527(+)